MQKDGKVKSNKGSIGKRIAIGLARFIGRLFAVVLAVAIVAVVTLIAAIYIISKSDCEVVKELFVTNMVETGAMDFCAHMFLTDEEVDAILAKNQIVVPEGKTDTTLIVVGDPEKDPDNGHSGNESGETDSGIEYDEDGICIIDIKGKTYVGKICFVRDPSRVKVAGLEKYGSGVVGKTTEQMTIDANALVGINAGGYQEMSDYRTGGIPEGREEGGIVIIDGKLLWGSRGSSYEVIGFDRDNILHIDRMTGQQALDIGIRDAVNWGPILVKNGEPCVVPTTGIDVVGFHPRTAIGQRADGSVMLVTIDGRQSHSLGASFTDLIEIFMRYKAVNAANLDGGMSTYMVYDNEIITSPYMLYFNGKRTVATSIIVTRPGSEG